MDETFLLTNIAPQVGDGFNRHCKTLFWHYFAYPDGCRLGISRGVVPPPSQHIPGCIRVYRSVVSAQPGSRWKVESGEHISVFVALLY